MQDSRIVKTYNKALNHFFKRYNIYFQSFNLQARATAPISQEDEKEYERLDNLRIEGMKYVEKKCRKQKMGGVSWTPDLTHLRLSIEVWMLVIKINRKCKVVQELSLERRLRKIWEILTQRYLMK